MPDSVWVYAREYDDALKIPAALSTAAAELPAITWALQVKHDLVEMQRATGIPAAGAVAQMIHEGWNPGGWTKSRLADQYNNWAGLKWAEWQRRHGGRPVSLATWEEIDGDRVDLVDAFAAFPSVSHFLAAYQELLTFPRYRGALAYSSQPLLWLHQVWASGWATDSRYLGGLGHWMAVTWPIYQDTLAPAPADLVDPRGKPVRIEDAAGRLLTTGWLLDPDGPGPEGERTVCLARDLVDAQGLTGKWIPGNPPAFRLSWPGAEI